MSRGLVNNLNELGKRTVGRTRQRLMDRKQLGEQIGCVAGENWACLSTRVRGCISSERVSMRASARMIVWLASNRRTRASCKIANYKLLKKYVETSKNVAETNVAETSGLSRLLALSKGKVTIHTLDHSCHRLFISRAGLFVP